MARNSCPAFGNSGVISVHHQFASLFWFRFHRWAGGGRRDVNNYFRGSSMGKKNWETPDQTEIKANPDHATKTYGGVKATHIHT